MWGMLVLREARMLAYRLPNLCYRYYFPGNSPLEIFIVMINLWPWRKETNFKWMAHLKLCHFIILEHSRLFSLISPYPLSVSRWFIRNIFLSTRLSLPSNNLNNPCPLVLNHVQTNFKISHNSILLMPLINTLVEYLTIFSFPVKQSLFSAKQNAVPWTQFPVFGHTSCTPVFICGTPVHSQQHFWISSWCLAWVTLLISHSLYVQLGHY